MERSIHGLEAAGEWHELKKMLPDFTGKRVLDLGCGFGWHCRYAVEQGACSVIGIDISKNMLETARQMTSSSAIQYIHQPIEEIEFQAEAFDIVISSLAFHYVESFQDICNKIKHCLTRQGIFVFSVEHPVFTAYGTQDWYCDEQGKRLHWPVDHYFTEGFRKANFLSEEVVKYHKTLTTYINSLLLSGFEITRLIEPEPEENMLKDSKEMQNELRRPMMLLISARKK